jgi:hypothetical protein
MLLLIDRLQVAEAAGAGAAHGAAAPASPSARVTAAAPAWWRAQLLQLHLQLQEEGIAGGDRASDDGGVSGGGGGSGASASKGAKGGGGGGGGNGSERGSKRAQPLELGWSVEEAEALQLTDEDTTPEAIMRRYEEHIQLCSPLLL